jgi:hypothetical protein
MIYDEDDGKMVDGEISGEFSFIITFSHKRIRDENFDEADRSYFVWSIRGRSNANADLA